MSVARENSDILKNLADLREESLTIIALFAGVASFIWYMWAGHPAIAGLAVPGSLVGIGALALSAGLGYLLKGRSLRLATHLLVWGIIGGIICALLAFPFPGLVYLFIVPIIFSSVLFSPRAFSLVAGVTAFLILATSSVCLHMPLLSVDTTLPIFVVALVTLASWLSRRSLHTALIWVWSGYEYSRQSEEVARQRASELGRALKALDEATHGLERTNYMLALARDQAEEARRLKQQFAQTISHELRTPLNLIVGFTELMTESPEHYGGPLPPAYVRDLNIAHRNACHLQKLVNDVLDLARIEAAQMGIVIEKTDPGTMVQEAVETVHSLVEAHGLVLYTEIEPDLPMLRVDPTRIRQVLFNLLNNAARFTEAGSVTVSVHQEDEEVVFAVTDTGVGIAPEDVEGIFEEFQQVDRGTQRRHNGAGLGLAISRQFVELHGGRIWVESEVGRGSTFYFSLPVDRTVLPDIPDRPLREAAYVGPAGRGSEKPVLLAVTRSPSAAALLARHVHSCRTVVVPDLDHARQAASHLMPQAVVVDGTCEELDPDRLERLGRDWGLPRVPFVACSLPGEEPLRQQLSVEGYLIKPVSQQSLWDTLRRFGEDVDNILVVDDDQDFVLLMSRMLEDSPVRRYRAISAYSGQEGLDMVRQHRPDLVLLDLDLPDGSGAQIVEHMRANPEWQHIPIVIVSGQDALADHATLRGIVVLARADGLTSGDVVGWVQHVVDEAVTPSPAPPVPRATPVL